MADALLAEMYRRVKRKPREGTITDAVRCHAQACGLVAYCFDVHPDRVAEAVSARLGAEETAQRSRALVNDYWADKEEERMPRSPERQKAIDDARELVFGDEGCVWLQAAPRLVAKQSSGERIESVLVNRKDLELAVSEWWPSRTSDESQTPICQREYAVAQRLEEALNSKEES